MQEELLVLSKWRDDTRIAAVFTLGDEFATNYYQAWHLRLAAFGRNLSLSATTEESKVRHPCITWGFDYRARGVARFWAEEDE